MQTPPGADAEPAVAAPSHVLSIDPVKRALVTAALLAMVFALQRAVAPGVDAFLVRGYEKNLSWGALGITPFLGGFTLVSLVTWVVPPLYEKRRYAESLEKMRRVAVWLGGGVAFMQALSVMMYVRELKIDGRYVLEGSPYALIAAMVAGAWLCMAAVTASDRFGFGRALPLLILATHTTQSNLMLFEGAQPIFLLLPGAALLILSRIGRHPRWHKQAEALMYAASVGLAMAMSFGYLPPGAVVPLIMLESAAILFDNLVELRQRVRLGETVTFATLDSPADAHALVSTLEGKGIAAFARGFYQRLVFSAFAVGVPVTVEIRKSALQRALNS